MTTPPQNPVWVGGRRHRHDLFQPSPRCRGGSLSSFKLTAVGPFGSTVEACVLFFCLRFAVVHCHV
ncbi:hypothetical protein A2U01_0077595, partial [Trifolium medium]|nr:hypothetical protein [Trifolium medium]